MITYDSSDSESEEEDENDNNYGQQHIFTQFDDNNMRYYLLLDNQSTIDLFCNPNFLTNIRKNNETLLVTKNGGGLKTSQMGTLKN